MRFTARTNTLLARELDQLTDRLNLLVLWLEAEDDLPNDLRHVNRDLIAALESVDLARMDVADSLADSTQREIEAARDRHPAGRHRTLDTDDQAADPVEAEVAMAWAEYRKEYQPNPDDLTAAHKAFTSGYQAARHVLDQADDTDALVPVDEIDPGVREFASLAALAFVADPERTRAVLAGIGSTDPREPGDIVAAPTFETTVDQLDGTVPPATPEVVTPHAHIDDQGTATAPEGNHTGDAPEAGTDALSARWDETHDAMLDDGDDAGNTL